MPLSRRHGLALMLALHAACALDEPDDRDAQDALALTPPATYRQEVLFGRPTELAPIYATFGSYNSRVVATSRGTFVSVLRKLQSGNEIDCGTLIWQLWYQPRGATGWQVLDGGYTSAKAPVIETDGSAVFLVAPAVNDCAASPEAGAAYFMRYAWTGATYGRTHLVTIPNAWAGKYALAYAAGSGDVGGSLIYMTWNRVWRLGADGAIYATQTLFDQGATLADHQLAEYPLLAADNGFVTAAITTTGISDPNNPNGWYADETKGNERINTYPGVAIFGSWTRGATWGGYRGGVSWPVDASWNGPLVQVTSPWQRYLAASNWLSGYFVKGGYVQLFYTHLDKRAVPTRRERYVCHKRYSLTTNAFDIDDVGCRVGELRGDALAINGMEQGYFTAHPQRAALYLVGVQVSDAQGQRVVVLKSTDQGGTWHVHAASPYMVGTITYVSGAHAIANDEIVGTYTLTTWKPGASPPEAENRQAVLFRVPATE